MRFTILEWLRLQQIGLNPENFIKAWQMLDRLLWKLPMFESELDPGRNHNHSLSQTCFFAMTSCHVLKTNPHQNFFFFDAWITQDFRL